MLADATEPYTPFAAWYAEAVASEPDVPNAMQLATANLEGRPSVRTVLLKDAGPGGWTFYTHYGSRKGRDIATNPYGAVVLHWKSLQRQVRAEGPIVKMDPALSDAYFATRDRESQLGAWASLQGELLADRDELEQAFAETERRFAGLAVPRPPAWGGWVLLPERVEFWQGRPGRLHDRVQFASKGGNWRRSVLAP